MKKIVLLRGINVGGKKKILMDDLRQMLASIGYEDAKTYIQSGNIILDSNEDNTIIGQKIESAIKDRIAFDVPAIVIDKATLAHIIEANPYTSTNDIKPEQLLVICPQDTPTKEGLDKLAQWDCGNDEFTVSGQHIYLYCKGPYHKSKLSNNTFEKKLGMNTTARGWRTLLKIMNMCE